MLLVKGYKFSAIRRLTFGNLMYRIMTVSNNTVLYICIHRHTQLLCEGMETVTNLYCGNHFAIYTCI